MEGFILTPIPIEFPFQGVYEDALLSPPEFFWTGTADYLALHIKY